MREGHVHASRMDIRAVKIAQRVKAPATKVNYLSSIPSTHMAGEN